MGPEYGPLPPLKGSDIWALGLCRFFFSGVYRGSPLKGPDEKSM